MGVYIFLDIMPSHINEEAWEEVYRESLQLLNAYPFMDKIVDEVSYDEPWIYVDRAREKELRLPLTSGDSYIGWHIFGDLNSMTTAESMTFVKNLKYYKHNRTESEYDDILADKVFLDIDSSRERYERRRFDDVRVFDGKTQGAPHHIYMLAIACLIESRFPKHALVFGDISIGQMKKAVDWANTILDKPIQVTERTDNKKLLGRIRSIVDNDMDALQAFMGLTFHDKDIPLGKFVQENFSNETITAYYTNRFKRYKPEQLGFRDSLQEFINQGYTLEAACDICVLDPNGCKYDADAFIDRVLSLAWRTEKEKPHEDLPIYKDADSGEPDTVYSQFGHVFLRMAGIEESVQSTMTYEEVLAVLEEKLDRTIEVEEQLGEEEEVDEEVKQEVNALIKRLGIDKNALKKDEKVETYDIDTFDDLIYWQPGDSLHPHIERNLTETKKFFKKTLEEQKEYFAQFQSNDARGKINLLIKGNRYFYIKKSAWDEIIDNIHNQELTNANFFALSVKAEELNTNAFYKALVNNQGLLREYIL